MKQRVSELACLGGAPEFADPLHVAQLNMPPWERVEAAFRDIFARRRYANHGPLVRELETRFARLLGVEHAVCVTNGTVALMLLARALELRGEVIVPAFSFPATVQAVSWAGLTPVLCDVDAATHMLDPMRVAERIGPGSAGILGAHLWGRACAPGALAELAERHGLALFFDACHGIACAHGGRFLGGFGAGEAFSFHATKVLNGLEGGCVTTNDARLAARLRTLRSFHGEETFCDAAPRMNAKMSEAQAAMALLSLDDLPANLVANRRRHAAYQACLAGIPGIEVVDYGRTDAHNHQYVVLDVDADAAGLSRDALFDLLEGENVLCRRHFHPPLHRLHSYRDGYGPDHFPVAEYLGRRLLQLPSGQAVSLEDTERVCGLIRLILAHGPELRQCVEAGR